ncbi:hypothetical protein [Bacillus rhizoplanae]|uniref:hypothetical protein n=1 Tax=Bacillus rhizoplanae TaxID=2880966 RepID=UPI003D196B93
MKQLEKRKLYLSEGQELIWHIEEVERGHNTYRFEIHKAVGYMAVYFIDRNQKRFLISNLEEMLAMIPDEISRKRYRNIIGDVEWLLLDGIHDFRGMTTEEQAVFLYLKEHVLDEMEVSLDEY